MHHSWDIRCALFGTLTLPALENLAEIWAHELDAHWIDAIHTMFDRQPDATRADLKWRMLDLLDWCKGLSDGQPIDILMRAELAQVMLDWFGQHDAVHLYISAITEAELRTGIAILPEGQLRNRLQMALDAMIEQDFQTRILPFDSPAARAYAAIAARCRAAGRPIAEADCQIAAIAMVAGAPVATRNVRTSTAAGAL